MVSKDKSSFAGCSQAYLENKEAYIKENKTLKTILPSDLKQFIDKYYY